MVSITFSSFCATIVVVAVHLGQSGLLFVFCRFSGFTTKSSNFSVESEWRWVCC